MAEGLRWGKIPNINRVAEAPAWLSAYVAIIHLPHPGLGRGLFRHAVHSSRSTESAQEVYIRTVFLCKKFPQAIPLALLNVPCFLEEQSAGVEHVHQGTTPSGKDKHIRDSLASRTMSGSTYNQGGVLRQLFVRGQR